jgi:hypothetical protein
MSEWIEINLPYWSDELKAHTLISYNFDDEVREQFGFTIEEKDIELFSSYEEGDEAFNEFWKESRKNSDFDTIKNGNNILAKKYIEFIEAERKIKEFIKNHPKSIEIKQKNDEILKASEPDTFCNRGLNNPGTLIEIKLKDGSVKKLLIGDINQFGGYSSEFCDEDAIVLRYKIVYTHNAD